MRGGGRVVSTRVLIDGVLVFQGDVYDVVELKKKVFHMLSIPPDLQDYGLPESKSSTSACICSAKLESVSPAIRLKLF